MFREIIPIRRKRADASDEEKETERQLVSPLAIGLYFVLYDITI